MRELVNQAGENDKLSTIYVIDDEEKFYGAIELQKLIVAREHEDLEDIISRSYPYVLDHEKISDCIEKIKDYARILFLYYWKMVQLPVLLPHRIL